MVLKVANYGTTLNYEYDYFDINESKVVLKEIQNPKNFIEIQYVLPVDNSFDDKVFDVFFLSKYNLKEGDIFQVFNKEESKRIGWCIPINALGSKEHNYIDNQHFLRYAYVAVKEAFRRLPEDIFTNTVDISASDRISILDIFHESTALLIISRETLGENCIFDLARALPSLIKFGYVRLSTNNPDLLTLNRELPNGDKFYIEFVSDQIDSSDLVPMLLENAAFCSGDNVVFQFFYLYQVVELLLECIFKHEQKILVQELLECKDDSSKTKEALEKVQRNISEKKRISLLVTKYIPTQCDLSSLKSSCNQLLVEIGKKEGNEFDDYFYSIRNFIFHQFRNFPPQKLNLLETVINDLIDVLPNILSNFSLPPISSDLQNTK